MVLGIVIAGCGDEGQREIPLDFNQPAFDDRFQSARCMYHVRCGEFPDMATCMTANVGVRSSRPFLITPSVIAAIRAGKMVYDEAKAEQCLELIATHTCDRTDSLGPYRELCHSILRGTVRAGGECAFDAECASEQCDVDLSCDLACCTGTCSGSSPEQPAAIGEPCSPYEAGCVEGAYCHAEPFSTSICRPLIGQGESCHFVATSVRCDFGLACLGAPGTETCQRLPARGEPCPDGVCRDDGVACNAAGMCTPAGLPGDACVANSDCSRFYVCDATNHCARGQNLGESCATHQCFDVDAFCNGSTCISLLDDGGSCITFDKSHHPDWCQSNECVGTYPHFKCGTSAACF